MSKYLRDEALKCLTIHEEALRRINNDIAEIANKVNSGIQRSNDIKNSLSKVLIPTYVIRFDGKGFRLYDFNEVLKYFLDAHKVERIIIYMQSLENIQSMSGKRVEIRLDASNQDNCYLVVEDDEKDWVDSVFTNLKDQIKKSSNKNWIFRNQFIVALVQLMGVLIGFLLSTWSAVTFAPMLKVENALLLIFIAVFLLFSNIWTFLFNWLLTALNYFWPNISFKRPSGLHWLLQAFIGTISFSFVVLIISYLFRYLSKVFMPLINAK